MVTKEGKKFPQYLAAITVCLGAVSTGTVLGWTGNISQELELGGLNNIIMDSVQLGWVASLSNLGAMVSCFPIGIICDLLGRKLATLLLTLPFVLGWLLMIFAQNFGMVLAGRFIVGMAGGAFCIAAPLYTSEIAEKDIRGALGSYFQLFVTIGILFTYILGYTTSIKVNTIIVAVIPLVFCITFALQPETPVYRLKQKKEKEAKASLVRLRGKDYDVDSEIEEIKKVLEELESNNITFKDSCKKRSTKIAAMVSFSLMFFQQAGGINAVIFYVRDIFDDAGSSLDPKEASMIVGAIQVIGTFAASIVVDKFGRRILLLTSAAFMAIGIIILGVFFSLGFRHWVEEATLKSIGYVPIIGVCLFIFVFSLGFGPIPWMIASELFPSEIKSVASAAAGTFNWLMAFLITKFYGDIALALGKDVPFYIFGGVCILGVVFILLVVPETKGKSLEQIQRELNKQPPLSQGVDNAAFSSEHS